MTDRHIGVNAYLRKAVLEIIVVYCVIHHHHLAAKNLSDILHETLQLVIKALNKIKINSLNDRLFRELCHVNDEKCKRLLLHTAVRRLSKEKCLHRFFFFFCVI